MCRYQGAPNLEYINDLRRGRMRDPSRFFRIADYAKARWQKSKDLKYALQWDKVEKAAKRRNPMSFT